MKRKLFTLSNISLNLSYILCTPLAFSEQISATNFGINNKSDETIVITANRTVQDKFDTLAAVDIFTRDTIDKIQPLSITDLLSRVAGVSVAAQGTSAHQSSVFVRGANSDHVLILINGVRVGSATLGTKSIADIPVQLIERMEIIRGPRAALWGADAIGGVIQIFTRSLNANEGQIGFKTGSNSLYQGYAAIGLGNEQHNYTISASAEKSQGFDIIVPNGSNDQSDDDGYKRQSIGLTGTSQFTKVYALEVSSQFDKGTTDIDANTLYSGDETNYENYYFLLRNQLQLSHANLQLSLSTSQDRTEDNYSDYNDNIDDNNFTTIRDQVSALIQIPFTTSSEIITGAEWYNERVESNNIYSETERDASALFITGRHSINQVKLEGSIRHDKVGDINGETTYQLAAGYQIGKELLLSISHGTAFKAPSFNDLYYPWSGNPNLISETSHSTELLTRYQNDLISVEISIYHSDFDNLIEWAAIDSSDPNSPWQPSNVAQAKILGGEATIYADIFDISNRLTLSHVDAEDKAKKSQLARRPNFSANYNLGYSIGQLDFAFDVNYQGSSYDTPTATEKALDAYTLMDIGLNYRLNDQLSLFTKVTNLANKNYQQVSEYPGAGREYTFTVDYTF